MTPDSAHIFSEIVNSRRSVRLFEDVPIPPDIMNRCLDLALLAPNSSNLQPWTFYWVRDVVRKAVLAEACLSQPAARTAAELIVCVGRTNTWRAHRREMLRRFEIATTAGQYIPKSAWEYYRKIVPIAYTQGWFGAIGLLKKIIFWGRGFFTPSPRSPTSLADMRVWAAKSCALACENMMLALRAHGFDSCPLEGFDAVRVRRLLKLTRDAEVVMVIAAGKASPRGVYGPRVRFAREEFVIEV